VTTENNFDLGIGRPSPAMCQVASNRCAPSRGRSAPVGGMDWGVWAGAVVEENPLHVIVDEAAFLLGSPHQLFGADSVEPEELVGHVGIDA
jgi:hypothetical protein